MSLRWKTPCDERDPMTGEYYCPYMSEDGHVDCAYWCSDHPDEDYMPEEDDRSMEDELEFVEWGYTND